MNRESIQYVVEEINRAVKTEETATFWLRNKRGDISTAHRKPISELIMSYLKSKGDKRILIDFIVSSRIIGDTDIEDPDKKFVNVDGKSTWVAEAVRRKYDGELADIAGEEIERLYIKIKSLEAALLSVID